MARKPDQSALSFGKDSPAEKARRDFPEPHAYPCRRDPATGATLYYHGFSAQGHAFSRWNGSGWDKPQAFPAAVLRKSVTAQLPPGATIPEGPKN